MISRVTQFFVDRYQLTVVLFLMLAVMGISSWASIPKAEDPAIPIPTYIVVAVYPGAQPVDIEQLVVDPIEEAMGELDGLDKIQSSVEDGVAVMRVEFEPEEDADEKYGEVVREINALRASLPGDLHSLDVNKVSASEVNIVQLALVPIQSILEADGSEATVYTLAADGRTARRLPVTVGFIAGERVAVSGGLEGVTSVVTDGAAYLGDGAAVKVVP